jgi:hypothetical protein
VHGFWPIFFLAVILKIPVACLLYLVWWAVRSPDQNEYETDEDQGFRRPHKVPPRPRGPRRGGPHAPDARPQPACPPGGRLRVLTPPAPIRVAATREHADDPVPGRAG